MAYTEEFSEQHAVLAKMGAAAATTEANSGYVSMAQYHRIAIVLHAVQVTTTCDLDVEVATDANATGVHTLKSITQLTSDDDGAIVVIELRAEELGKPDSASSYNYDYVNVEITPNGALTYSCIIYGIEPRYAPVSQTAFDEVVA